MAPLQTHRCSYHEYQSHERKCLLNLPVHPVTSIYYCFPIFTAFQSGNFLALRNWCTMIQRDKQITVCCQDRRLREMSEPLDRDLEYCL